MEVFRCHMSTERPALLNMSLARLGRVSCLSEGFVYSNGLWGQRKLRKAGCHQRLFFVMCVRRLLTVRRHQLDCTRSQPVVMEKLDGGTSIEVFAFTPSSDQLSCMHCVVIFARPLIGVGKVHSVLL